MLNLIRPTLMGTALSLPTASSRIAVRNFSGSMVALKKKVIDPTLPVPPKNPPSAYTLFFKQYVLDPSNHVRNSDGKLDMKQVATAAGQAWTNLPSSSKSPYDAEASSLRKEYESAYRKFWDGTTSETRREIESVTGKKLKVPGGKKAYQKSVSERSGNPGKPLTPYLAFTKELRDQNKLDIPSDLTPREAFLYASKEAGRLWKELGEEAQKTYKDTYAAAKAKWEEWKVTQKDL
ncbi:hypothetical protein L486_00661 [Kwoniella mangroviensis CBS 10435]|uniref:HMG box domain-containing protein n=1 Tax=Kwoniella mangroviensis CBS 10435 TaxID=1331196 RepID=A0A1B9IZQ8_9TREE|nr:hypothetical protein L486_00661 [Kwoniella mangroviensis CBS 10435]OCF74235.1 hypothetical protein I204_04605 [Kwoniella mangroviensis CBS 8886]